MGHLAVIEQSHMGRPKRTIRTTSIKVEEDVAELVRKAALFHGITAVEYASRILRDRAKKDLLEGAEKYVRENAADKPPKGKKKGGGNDA